MSHVRISQREARRLKKRVEALEQQIKAEHVRWSRDYPGTHLGSVTIIETGHVPAKVDLARQLGWSVVCMADGQTIHFYAVKP